MKKYFTELPTEFGVPIDAVGQRILHEYGALFVARGGAVVPNAAIFRDESEVADYQSSLSVSSENFGSFDIELQTAAMEKLRNAIADAKKDDLTITPRGTDSGKRLYSETVELWASRVNPGLRHWVEKGKLTAGKASKILALPPFEQVPVIFDLESHGMFFSKDLSKSIVYSVAPPGASQHLSLLALDINEHDSARVRGILADYGWFQTVVSDLPHFTFLGVAENQLSGLGLKRVSAGGRAFWLPDL